MAQQDGQCLHSSTRTQVRSQASPEGSKDLALPQLGHRLQLQLKSDPWPGNPMCPTAAEKEKKSTKCKWPVTALLVR